MLPGIIQSSSIPVLQEVLAFTETRHELLAANIANMDTPGYLTRDLSVPAFQQALKQAVETQQSQRQPLAEGVVDRVPANEMHKVRESLKNILYHDGSDVSIEQQVAELSKNQMLHNTAIALISSQFHLLEAAISERV